MSDNTTTKVYWLNGMAGTGKTTIAYSFSEMLDEENFLGGTFVMNDPPPFFSSLSLFLTVP